jgi:signal transduction histidine kinase
VEQSLCCRPADPIPVLTSWLRGLDLSRPIPREEVKARFAPLRDCLDATLAEFPIANRHPLNAPKKSIVLSTPILRYVQATPHDRENARQRILDGIRRFIHYAQLARKAGALSALRRCNADLVQVVRHIVELHQVDCMCSLQVPDGVPGTAAIDAHHFSLAITELFENSRKYCDKERLVITVELDLAHGGGHCVRLLYTDNGPGLPRDCKLTAFDKGSHWNRGNARGGTGLGLYYVAEVVRRHDGQIEEVGEEGKGVCFLIFFPRFCPGTAV